MSDEFRATDRVSILTPRRTVIRDFSTKKSADPIRSFRIDDNTYNTIHEGAALLKISASEFIRWCALFVANEVIGQHTTYIRSGQLARVEKQIVVDETVASNSPVQPTNAYSPPTAKDIKQFF